MSHSCVYCVCRLIDYLLDRNVYCYCSWQNLPLSEQQQSVETSSDVRVHCRESFREKTVSKNYTCMIILYSVHISLL